jgi:hypothetical protein
MRSKCSSYLYALPFTTHRVVVMFTRECLTRPAKAAFVSSITNHEDKLQGKEGLSSNTDIDQ